MSSRVLHKSKIFFLAMAVMGLSLNVQSSYHFGAEADDFGGVYCYAGCSPTTSYSPHGRGAPLVMDDYSDEDYRPLPRSTKRKQRTRTSVIKFSDYVSNPTLKLPSNKVEKIKVMNGIFGLLLTDTPYLTESLRKKAFGFYKHHMREDVKLGTARVAIPKVSQVRMKNAWSKARGGRKWIQGKRAYTVIPLIYCQEEHMAYWAWNITALTPTQYSKIRKGRKYWLLFPKAALK